VRVRGHARNSVGMAWTPWARAGLARAGFLSGNSARRQVQGSEVAQNGMVAWAGGEGREGRVDMVLRAGMAMA
jgi:hypothetical protein